MLAIREVGNGVHAPGQRKRATFVSNSRECGTNIRYLQGLRHLPPARLALHGAGAAKLMSAVGAS